MIFDFREALKCHLAICHHGRVSCEGPPELGCARDREILRNHGTGQKCAATLALTVGVSPKIVSEQLGHTSAAFYIGCVFACSATHAG